MNRPDDPKLAFHYALLFLLSAVLCSCAATRSIHQSADAAQGPMEPSWESSAPPARASSLSRRSVRQGRDLNDSDSFDESSSEELSLQESPVEESTAALSPMEGSTSAPGSLPSVSAPTTDSSAPTTNSSKRTIEPILIYEAHLTLAVFHTQENIDRIQQMTVKCGGYLVSRDQTRITVRIPARSFQGSLTSILQLGDVLERRIAVQDVTEEYSDATIRLKNALALRSRLEALLKNVTNVKDALRVEQELARVTGQMEELKGRLKLLRELSSYSTITVEFTERRKSIDKRVRLPFPWLNQLGLHHLLHL